MFNRKWRKSGNNYDFRYFFIFVFTAGLFVVFDAAVRVSTCFERFVFTFLSYQNRITRLSTGYRQFLFSFKSQNRDLELISIFEVIKKIHVWFPLRLTIQRRRLLKSLYGAQIGDGRGEGKITT